MVGIEELVKKSRYVIIDIANGCSSRGKSKMSVSITWINFFKH